MQRTRLKRGRARDDHPQHPVRFDDAVRALPRERIVGSTGEDLDETGARQPDADRVRGHVRVEPRLGFAAGPWHPRRLLRQRDRASEEEERERRRHERAVRLERDVRVAV